MIAFASSLDQAGPMTRSAEDAALMLTAMAGFDERFDQRAAPGRRLCSALGQRHARARRHRQGIHGRGLDAGVGRLVQNRRSTSRRSGRDRRVSLPNAGLSVPAYYVVAPAECSSNLARFDGVRYGHRCQPKDLEICTNARAPRGFGAEVKRASCGHLCAVGRLLRCLLPQGAEGPPADRRRFPRRSNECDLIASPTAPGTAFRLGEKADDPVSMYLQDIYTIAVNLAGLPGCRSRHRQRRYAGRPAADRQLFRRGAAAQRRAPAAAGDRLASSECPAF